MLKIPQEFSRQLNSYSKSSFLTGHFIVENEALSQTHIFRVIWEKFKGLLGFGDRTNARLIQFKIVQFLWEKRLFVTTDEQIQQIRKLAKRAGIESFNEKNQKSDPLHIREIIEGICQKSFQNEGQDVPYNFFGSFFKYYKKELAPFSKEIEKVVNVFHHAVSSEELAKEGELAEEDQARDQNKNTENVDQNPMASSDQKEQQGQKWEDASTAIFQSPNVSTSSERESIQISTKDFESSIIEKTRRKFEVLTRQALTSPKWRTAGKLAACGSCAIALGVIGYVCWQDSGSVMAEEGTNFSKKWNVPELENPHQTLCEISETLNPFAPQSLANFASATQQLIVKNTENALGYIRSFQEEGAVQQNLNSQETLTGYFYKTTELIFNFVNQGKSYLDQTGNPSLDSKFSAGNPINSPRHYSDLSHLNLLGSIGQGAYHAAQKILGLAVVGTIGWGLRAWTIKKARLKGNENKAQELLQNMHRKKAKQKDPQLTLQKEAEKKARQKELKKARKQERELTLQKEVQKKADRKELKKARQEESEVARLQELEEVNQKEIENAFQKELKKTQRQENREARQKNIKKMFAELKSHAIDSIQPNKEEDFFSPGIMGKISHSFEFFDAKRIEYALRDFNSADKAASLFALLHLDFMNLDMKGVEKKAKVILPFLIQQLSLLLKDAKLGLDSKQKIEELISSYQLTYATVLWQQQLIEFNDTKSILTHKEIIKENILKALIANKSITISTGYKAVPAGHQIALQLSFVEENGKLKVQGAVINRGEGD